MREPGFDPLLGKMDNEDCFGFHSEYYVDPEWRKAGRDLYGERWRYFFRGYSAYSKYQDDIYFIAKFDHENYAIYVIKANVKQKMSCAIKLDAKKSLSYSTYGTYMAVNRRGYFIYNTATITLFGFDGREIYTHKFGKKYASNRVCCTEYAECVYIYDDKVIYSETKQTAGSTQIYCVNMLTQEKQLVWGSQKGDYTFDNHLRESFRQEWGIEWPFSKGASEMGKVSCQFLYANKHRIIAGYTREYDKKEKTGYYTSSCNHYSVSYIVNIDLAEHKWSLLDCFVGLNSFTNENKDSLPSWDNRHIFSFNMLGDTMWVKTSDQDIRLVHTDIQRVAQLQGKYSVGWKLCPLSFVDKEYSGDPRNYYYFDGKIACIPRCFGEYRLTTDGEWERIDGHPYQNLDHDFWCFDGIYLVPNEYHKYDFTNVANGNVEYSLRGSSYDNSTITVEKLIQNAKQPQLEAAVRSKKDVSLATPHKEEKVDHSIAGDCVLSLAAFRRDAPSMTAFREQLLSYRKSLPNSWDYNAFVGILLGVRGPKHGDAACMNFAIGQGDNGNNTRKTLEAKELMPVFEKYKGKKIDESILLSDVEDEIVSAAPNYAEIRKKFHEIVFAGAGGTGSGAEATAAFPHKNVDSAAPVTEDSKEIPHTEPAAEETKDASEIIDSCVTMLALRVLEYVANDKTIDRADIRGRFRELRAKLYQDQQKFEAYFGTSSEARWLYSALPIVERSMIVDDRGEHVFFLHDKYEIDKAVSLLQELPEGKYGIAYYALAKCYGVGIDAIIDVGDYRSKDKRSYVLRPNFPKMIEYLRKAVEARKPENEAFIDFGCANLSIGDYQRAKRAFELAKGRGCGEKADIYLRYMKCCEHAVPAINGQRTRSVGYNDSRQHICGNIVEYKDRIYWMCQDKQQRGYSSGPIILCSLGADGKRTVLASIERSYNSRLNIQSAADAGLYFSICNDLIYYENGSGGICTMRLDGSDQRELTDIAKHGNTYVSMPMAFPEFLLYIRGNGQIWKRDQSGETTMIGKASTKNMIAGVSEREINIGNELLIDLRTLEKQKVVKKYPAIKGKTVVYIDMAREIAYYEDGTDTRDCRDRRLIGVNTRGEIADYWEMPLIPYEPEGYTSFCFNGLRLSVKVDCNTSSAEGYTCYLKRKSISAEECMELWKKRGPSELEQPFVALFDRRGNRQLLHMKKGKSVFWFGAFHMMTDNGVVVLENLRLGGRDYWNTYYPVRPKGAIPPTKLDFFCN